ncbi:MAG TPA: valine--tRNA ligase [Candidatus Sulfomarinibacteraceae bacterium]|nr:valine--tRNA ligase [Candidatus Sulfomarinibacteraceae bacterium]
MSLPKRYKPRTREPQIAMTWQEKGVYHFDPHSEAPVFSIDTPPPTVSGNLHLGHVYSYSHTDFLARFWRMNGYNVFYPMGFDDNGLPTERLVERREGVRAADVGRRAFIERCLRVGEEAQQEYKELWQRLGLSVDWRHTYRTIEEKSRRLAQWSFLDLYRKGLAYRAQAPAIWCPECQTAIAQAEVDDLARDSTFYTLAFTLRDGATLPIATTRPELLPACVAIFIHPEDPRRSELEGQTARVPLFGQDVPILTDAAVDPETGTGVVMCCTFGDTADVAWWRAHDLPLVEAIGRDGRMLEPAGQFAGLETAVARRQMARALQEQALMLAQEPLSQTVRVHERCDTPVEYVVAWQWFISVLENKEQFLADGERLNWRPPHMKARYRQWVENLAWDWGISRQRAFGVTFPLWYCDECDAVILADEAELPVDPTVTEPSRSCPECGSASFTPETDVMDTWATSSLSPQIVGQMTGKESLYRQVFPFSLRPQAHEIIRTWAFYTIVKSRYHFDALPWRDVAISGWGLAPHGSGKISKSKGGDLHSPMEMIDAYSADALRYWAASTGLGKDSIIDEQKMQAGAKLITKLWNVARFSARFLHDYEPARGGAATLDHTFTPADRWLLSRTQRLIARVTELFQNYDYATAKSEIELFFWTELADNYLEMAKKRLYDGGEEAAGARFTLYQALLATVKLLAPFLPYVTEAIYQGLLETEATVHQSAWPLADRSLLDSRAEQQGALLVEIATAVRRYKSEANLSLGAELAHLHLTTADEALASVLEDAEPDLVSITRARTITVGSHTTPDLETITAENGVGIALASADSAS